MKSTLKRLFTSILPTSWVADENNNRNQRKQAAERYFDNTNSIDALPGNDDSQNPMADRIMRKPIKRRGGNSNPQVFY
jgi:hypothetical protein